MAITGGMGSAGSTAPPLPIGWFLIVLGSVFVLVGEALAVCTILAGRYLQTHRAWLFCMIVAAANCLAMPMGTVLCVFAFIVLLKPEVKQLFAQQEIY